MKILIASTFYYPFINGGAEISTQIMAEGLVRKGHKVEIVTIGERDVDEIINEVIVHRRKMEDGDIALSAFKDIKKITKYKKLKEIYNEFCYSRKYFYFYLKLMKTGKYDLVHASGNLYCLGRYNFWKAANRLNIPISQALRDPKLCHLDFANGKIDWLFSYLSHHSIKRNHSIVAPSQYMFDYYKAKGITHKKSVVIYNAVDIRPINVNFEKKKNQILYVGRLSEEKGINTLIRAISEISIPVQLIIIGRGNGLDKTVLEKNINVIGYLPREMVYKYMSESKAVVLPSEWPEAFGRTIIESIANGTIAIGSDSGAIPEILDSKFVFETKNHVKLAEIIQEVLLYSKEDYIKTVDKLQKECEKYSLDIYIENWENFFDSQIDKRVGI